MRDANLEEYKLVVKENTTFTTDSKHVPSHLAQVGHWWTGSGVSLYASLHCRQVWEKLQGFTALTVQGLVLLMKQLLTTVSRKKKGGGGGMNMRNGRHVHVRSEASTP